MANGDNGSAVVPCPLCAFANPADAARCARCGVPTDLMQCPNCDAVNPTSTAGSCWRCSAPLASTEPAPPRALPPAVHRLDRLGDIVGTYIGFAIFFGLVAFAGYRLLGSTHSGENIIEPSMNFGAALEPLASAPPVALQFPPVVDVDTVFDFETTTSTTITPRRGTHKPHSRTRAPEHVVIAEAVVPPDQPVSTPLPRVIPQKVASSRRATHAYCTGATLGVDQCRPEGLITGQ